MVGCLSVFSKRRRKDAKCDKMTYDNVTSHLAIRLGSRLSGTTVL
jgi:hypothetical protein